MMVSENVSKVGLLLTVLTTLLCMACPPRQSSDSPNAPIKKEMHLPKALKAIPIQDYVGKPVADLLTALPKYDEYLFMDNSRPAILGGAMFRFGKRWLQVYTYEIVHQPRFNEKYAWDFELFKKELISRVEWDE
jgi:hypothetical protein